MSENKRRFLNPEMFIALSAVLVGVCALTVSVYEANIFRKQQKASVWPYLELSYSHTHNNFSYYIQNKGVGPAIMKWMVIKIDDKPIKNWSDYRRVIFTNDSVLTRTSYINGRVISPNEIIKMISFSNEKAMQQAQAAINNNRISVEFCYSSIFDDFWTVKMDSTGSSRYIKNR